MEQQQQQQQQKRHNNVGLSPLSSLNNNDNIDDMKDHVHNNQNNMFITPKRQKVVVPNDSDTTSLTDRIYKMARIVELFLLDESHRSSSSSIKSIPPLEYFQNRGGVLLLVLSVIMSRSISTIQDEFDDPIGTHLTGQFGHCSQELINLLLTGQAVSNVFDNTLSPSGDMICRGIQYRPNIGYLTQLEAMRYCEMGSYYKMPLFPIWVVGSTSHFTVLFGDPTALKESKSDLSLDECRRAFKAVEGGEENGFIQTDQLVTVLNNLNIDIGGTSESDNTARVQALAASLEVSGAPIILWDDFWKAASRLLIGASLETILHGVDGSNISNPILIDGADNPPPLLTEFSVNSQFQIKPEARRPTESAVTNFVESDEEMARRLQAEWENDGSSGMIVLSNAAEAYSECQTATSMNIDDSNGAMDDEEYARYLQNQYDSENAVDVAISGDEGGSVVATIGSPFPVLSDTDETTSLPTTPTGTTFIGDDEYDDAKPAAQLALSTVANPFEQFGGTFSLYHYNGLRGGVLTPFRMTRLSAEEAVGTSIALNRGAGAVLLSKSSGTQDLEDVVRTKWPSCTINWLGNAPPYID